MLVRLQACLWFLGGFPPAWVDWFALRPARKSKKVNKTRQVQTFDFNGTLFLDSNLHNLDIYAASSFLTELAPRHHIKTPTSQQSCRLVEGTFFALEWLVLELDRWVELEQDQWEDPMGRGCYCMQLLLLRLLREIVALSERVGKVEREQAARERGDWPRELGLRDGDLLWEMAVFEWTTLQDEFWQVWPCRSPS